MSEELSLEGGNRDLVANWRQDSLPAHIQQELASGQVQGVKEVSRFIVPNRLTIVQSQSTDLLEKGFTPGQVIAQPLEMLVAENNTEFSIVPLYFFTEYIVWNPRGFDLNAIAERTRDERSEIAQIARDPNRRNKMPCLDKHGHQLEDREGKLQFYKYQEHLNFILCLPEVNPRALFVISFSRTQHRKGSGLCSHIQMRGASIYAGAYVCRVPSKLEENAQGKWYGWQLEPDGWVGEPLFSWCKQLHQNLAANDADIQVEYDEEVNNPDSANTVEGRSPRENVAEGAEF